MSGNGETARCLAPDNGASNHTFGDAMDFRITGLPVDRFVPLFGLPDDELARHRAVRRVCDSRPGFPCRVSLEDAIPGESVLLVNYEHLPVDSPYRSSHAIYVRERALPVRRGQRRFPPCSPPRPVAARDRRARPYRRRRGRRGPASSR
jgi:hypothetical protein